MKRTTITKYPRGIRTSYDRDDFRIRLSYLWKLLDNYGQGWKDELRSRWQNPEKWPHDDHARALKALPGNGAWLRDYDLEGSTERPVFRRANNPGWI